MKAKYPRKGLSAHETERVVILMPKDEVDAIDSWGIPAGMPSRTATVRHLLKTALERLARSEVHPNQMAAER